MEISPLALTGLIGILGTCAGIVLNHFLEAQRSKKKLILEKKIEVYSEILISLNTVFQDKEKNLLTDPLFKQRIHIELAKSLTKGRLLGGEKLENKLRDYYESAVEFWEGLDGKNDAKKKNNNNQMSTLVIEIEEMMRKDIGTR